jgi:hypothetical protein
VVLKDGARFKVIEFLKDGAPVKKPFIGGWDFVKVHGKDGLVPKEKVESIAKVPNFFVNRESHSYTNYSGRPTSRPSWPCIPGCRNPYIW